MVAGYTAAQVRAAEKPLLDAGVALMRSAASALAGVIRSEIARLDSGPGDVVFLVGSGDNGGDALFAAAELARDGYGIEVYAASDRMHPEAAEAARRAGIELRVWPREPRDRLETSTIGADIVVDGLLGTGSSGSGALRGAAREMVADVIRVLASTGARVIAVDLPSGIHPDDGSVPDPTVLRADVTVTFGAAKAGLLIEPGADHAGRIEVVDLGLGPYLAQVEPVVERS